MTRCTLLPMVALFAMAAAPGTSFTTVTPAPDYTPQRRPAAPAAAPPGYVAAPTPNQDAFAPKPRASNETSVEPGFFTRRDQYRGEGLSPSSSTQAAQDRRAKPGAGLKLSVPLQ